ncbi:MAG: molybdenum cofactor guanylyltransferase MobA [Rhodocyclaceae bacterium]|nr:molybdenum cofactor guanylyltransferase MobA [Rhodocyclaceae bacterium]
MNITGLILAGGRATRMGGCDKGLQLYRGQSLIGHVIERLAPQVDRIIINANRNIPAYAGFGYPVVRDQFDGFAGPLAGLHAGLTACETPLLVVVPCDAPLLPTDLVARLQSALNEHASVAQTTQGTEPTFMLCRRTVLPMLEQALMKGERKFGAWQRSVGAIEVNFEDESAFKNMNTHTDLLWETQ